MEIDRVFAVYFSPTGGTKRYVEGIAGRLSPRYETVDLTRPEVRGRQLAFGPRDLVILGAPVYAGRLPGVEGGIFDRLRGENTPAVFNVSYGNRDYDDALLEEMDLCQARGFAGVAAAAWIAPHTFSDRIAAGRPDDRDQAAMDRFAGLLREALGRPGELPRLTVRGARPYRAGASMSFHPEGGAGCTGCGLCASVCPTGAICPEDPRRTDESRCIDCLACGKNCPAGARAVPGPELPALTRRLEAGLLAVRREPEFFLP